MPSECIRKRNGHYLSISFCSQEGTLWPAYTPDHIYHRAPKNGKMLLPIHYPICRSLSGVFDVLSTSDISSCPNVNHKLRLIERSTMLLDKRDGVRWRKGNGNKSGGAEHSIVFSRQTIVRFNCF